MAPKEIKRQSIQFPADLHDLIEKDAAASFRSFSSHVICVLTNEYQRRAKETGIFTAIQSAVLGTEREVPVFRSPPPAISKVSKTQGSPGQEGS